MKIKSIAGTILLIVACIVTLHCGNHNPTSSSITPNATLSWEQLSPIPTSNALFAVQYLTTKEALVIGQAKTLLRTTDGGLTWHAEESDFSDDASDMFFLDERIGWVAGNNGMILQTNNGGRTWHTQKSGTTYGLRAIFFLDTDHGWAVGNTGIILRTVDGGVHWKSVQIENVYVLRDVVFADMKRGWAIGLSLTSGNGTVLLTTDDGGQTWRHIDVGIPDDLGGDLPSDIFVQLSAISRTPNGKITVVGECIQGLLIGGIRLYSENDGGSWSYKFTDIPHYAIQMLDNMRGWIVGYGGTIFETSDGGRSWTMLDNPSGYSFSSVSFANEQIGCAVGQAGSIHITTDGGSIWTQVTQGGRSPLEDIYFTDAYRGWVVGYGGMLRTEDGGKTWFKTGSNANQSISFISNDIGYAGTFQGDVDKSIDGGITWTRIVDNISSRVYDIKFYDTLVGWTCGNESIRKTTDGGKTWYTKWLTDRYDLLALTFVGERQGWCVGGKGIILHTDNAGETWSQQQTNTNAIFTDVFFLDSLTGWAVGSVGTIVVTHNGGLTWEFQSPPGSYANATLFSITFPDSNNGWVVGTDGLMLHTIDGGQSWVQQSTPSAEELWGVFALNANTAWACGWNGTILHTSEEPH